MLRWESLCLMTAFAASFAATGNAEAAVQGNTYQVEVDSTVSGEFDAVVSFGANGFLLVADDGTVGAGTYTESGGFISIVDATGASGEGYVGSFRALAIGNSLIIGRGSGNAGDTFTFMTIR